MSILKPATLTRWLLGCGLCILAAVQGLPAAIPLTFEGDIRPIFKANCFDCHGEGEKLEGGLDLRLRRFMERGGESGPAIVAGDASASVLLQKVRSGEMPKRERKLSASEIELVSRWIQQGARTLRPEPETLSPGLHITAEERAHWAFQPVRESSPPLFGPDERVRTPIDAFIGATLREGGVGFAPDAEGSVLIRRLCLDLTGLPPSPEQVAAYLEDATDGAYDRLVERLLASPQYGERWARHWLDVAGYADSEGYNEADAERNYAWKYRDYVINAFNADLPMDRFITEQMAGDELVLAVHPDLRSAIADPEAVRRLVATGFLRMGADGTGGSVPDADAARNAVVADTIKIVSTSLLGLSVGCAQCHDHRYEPIPQRDYYGLRAILEPAYDWKNWRTPSGRLISLYTEEERAHAEAVEAEAGRLGKERTDKQQEFIEAALKEHLTKFEPELREQLDKAYHTPAEQRTAQQKKLLADHPSVNIHPGVLYQYNPKAAEELKAMDTKIAEVRSRKPVEDFIRALTEPSGALPVTYRFHRGDPKQPREAVAPGGLSVLRLDGEPEPLSSEQANGTTSGRRLAMARWMTSGRHPLTGRVLVNRVWLHHFGRGLVGTPADFGLQGDRPTHPELLDWLAARFVAPAEEGGLGWSLKALHRLIVRSTVYRQASRVSGSSEPLPYAHKPLVRLDAEAVRDSILAVSGALNLKMGGSPVPVREDETGQIVVGIDKKQGDNKMPVEVAMGAEEFRRSIYVQVRRSRPLAFLNVFDAPVMEVNCEQRTISTAAPQALMLMNSGFILQQAGFFADRLRREAGEDRVSQIARAWQLAFSRPPTERELVLAQTYLDRRLAGSTEQGSDGVQDPAGQALTDLCQTLLSANEFLYVD